jgi:hypothetical protein
VAKMEFIVLWDFVPCNVVEKCCLPIEVPDARFKIFIVVKIKFMVFWVVAPCSVVMWSCVLLSHYFSI